MFIQSQKRPIPLLVYNNRVVTEIVAVVVVVVVVVIVVVDVDVCSYSGSCWQLWNSERIHNHPFSDEDILFERWKSHRRAASAGEERKSTDRIIAETVIVRHHGQWNEQGYARVVHRQLSGLEGLSAIRSVPNHAHCLNT